MEAPAAAAPPSTAAAAAARAPIHAASPTRCPSPRRHSLAVRMDLDDEQQMEQRLVQGIKADADEAAQHEAAARQAVRAGPTSPKAASDSPAKDGPYKGLDPQVGAQRAAAGQLLAGVVAAGRVAWQKRGAWATAGLAAAGRLPSKCRCAHGSPGCLVSWGLSQQLAGHAAPHASAQLVPAHVCQPPNLKLPVAGALRRWQPHPWPACRSASA
jgi:hypothetical protein